MNSRGATQLEELEVYRRAFALQQAIFGLTNSFPREEAYSLTDQVRRSSRSIGANLAEAWRKRRYEAHFLSKLTDADAEFSETAHWVKTANACGYITHEELVRLIQETREIGAMLGRMIHGAADWCRR